LDISKLKVGDLLFFDHDPSSREVIDHVGIYIGNGQIIHSNGGGRAVGNELDPGDPRNYVNIKGMTDEYGELTEYYKQKIISVSRLIQDNTTITGAGENTENGGMADEGFDYEWTGEYVTPAFKAKVIEICKKLQMNPDDLMAIMAFESNGIDPTAVNPISGATGLIQFMPSTARGLGTSTEALAKMSAIEQLDYVYKYFEPYTGKLHNISDAYMVVFMPVAVGKDDDFALGIRNSDEELAKGLTKGKVFAQNSVLDVDRNGVFEKNEAAQKVIDHRDKYKKIR
jgi:hypothetical protein